MIKLKLDLKKLDKELLFNADSGAVYLDAVLIETPNSNYSDYMIVQDLSKERREAGEKGPIVGNASRILPKNKANQGADVSAADNAPGPGTTDDLPF